MMVPVSKLSANEQLEPGIKPPYLPGIEILFQLLFEPPFLLTFLGTFITRKDFFFLGKEFIFTVTVPL